MGIREVCVKYYMSGRVFYYIEYNVYFWFISFIFFVLWEGYGEIIKICLFIRFRERRGGKE